MFALELKENASYELRPLYHAVGYGSEFGHWTFSNSIVQLDPFDLKKAVLPPAMRRLKYHPASIPSDFKRRAILHEYLLPLIEVVTDDPLQRTPDHFVLTRVIEMHDFPPLVVKGAASPDHLSPMPFYWQLTNASQLTWSLRFYDDVRYWMKVENGSRYEVGNWTRTNGVVRLNKDFEVDSPLPDEFRSLRVFRNQPAPGTDAYKNYLLPLSVTNYPPYTRRPEPRHFSTSGSIE